MDSLKFQKRLIRKTTSLNCKIFESYTTSFTLQTIFKLEDEFLIRGENDVGCYFKIYYCMILF